MFFKRCVVHLPQAAPFLLSPTFAVLCARTVRMVTSRPQSPGVHSACLLLLRVAQRALTTIRKWEVDTLREQVCVATVALPLVLVTVDADSASDEVSQGGDSAEESELRLRLWVQGPGPVALGASGYADDT